MLGEKKTCDGNEKSLEMVRLLLFMNIICVQIPSTKLYQAFFSQIKRLTIYQNCNELWFDMKSKKNHTNKNHSNIWMENVKYPD